VVNCSAMLPTSLLSVVMGLCGS